MSEPCHVFMAGTVHKVWTALACALAAALSSSAALADVMQTCDLNTRAHALHRSHTCVCAGVHASGDGADVACPISLIEWFLNFYKETQTGAVQPLEGICRAGEVLFVPRGWWHMALNLEVGLLLFERC